VWGAVYDDGKPDLQSGTKYAKAAAALHCKPEEIQQRIEQWTDDLESLGEIGKLLSTRSAMNRQVSSEIPWQCAPEIWAPDRWNNLTRLIDRFVCVVVVVPAQLLFVQIQRPFQKFPFDAAVIFLFFFLAWGTCATGQYYRLKFPCGVRKVKTDEGVEIVIEKGYEMYMLMHQVWHLLLVLGMCLSAVYRPEFDFWQDPNPFWEGVCGGMLFGLTVGVSGMAIAMRLLHLLDVNMVTHFNEQRTGSLRTSS